MNIPLEYGVIVAGTIFGVFGLVVVALDERRLKRELDAGRSEPESKPEREQREPDRIGQE